MLGHPILAMANRKPKPLDAEQLWEHGLAALGRRAHSVSELRVKLRARAAQAGDVDEVLSRLKSAGYLNDREFAQTYASARLQNQGFGSMRVLRDLLSHRVAPAVAKQAVDQTFRDTDETALIEDFLRRKYRGVELASYLQENKYLASAYRRLRLAGFSPGNSIRVLKRFAAQADLLEGMEESDHGS